MSPPGRYSCAPYASNQHDAGEQWPSLAALLGPEKQEGDSVERGGSHGHGVPACDDRDSTLAAVETDRRVVVEFHTGVTIFHALQSVTPGW